MGKEISISTNATHHVVLLRHIQIPNNRVSDGTAALPLSAIPWVTRSAIPLARVMETPSERALETPLARALEIIGSQ